MQKNIKIWHVDVNNIVISKLVETKTNFKYLIGYLDKAVRLLVLILCKMSRYVNSSKVKDGDKYKNIKLMSFCIDDDNVLAKYKTIRTKIKD